MDTLPKRDMHRKREELSDEDKREIAVKKAKLDRARKVVNNSFDLSVGGLKRRRRKVKNTHSQSFVLRQASALERKNKDIISALARARQYITQLERRNIQYREQEMRLAMRLNSYERKLKDKSAQHQNLKNLLIAKESLIGRVQSQLSTVLTVISSEDETAKDLEISASSINRLPLRVAKPTNNSDDQKTSSSDDDDENEDLEEQEASDNQVVDAKTARLRSASPLSNLSTLEEDSDASEDEEEEGENHGIDDENSSPLLQQMMTESNPVDHQNDAHTPKTPAHSEALESPISPGVLARRPRKSTKRLTTDISNQTFADLQLYVSFTSSEDGEKSDESEDSSSESEGTVAARQHDISVDDITTYSSVSMDLTAADTETAKIVVTESQSVEKPVDKDESNDVTKNVPNLTKTSSRRNKSVLKEKTNNKLTKEGKKKQTKPSTEQNSLYDFLSCSTDSFVRDPSKGVKLNSSRSFSPARLDTTIANHRHSEPGASTDENMEPSRPSRRRAKVSYAEPKLGTKLRREHHVTDGSICNVYKQRNRGKGAEKRAKSK